MDADFPKRCGNCGRVYSKPEWARLPCIGTGGDDVETLEFRNCPCGSTLTIVCATSSGIGPNGRCLSGSRPRSVRCSRSWSLSGDLVQFPVDVLDDRRMLAEEKRWTAAVTTVGAKVLVEAPDGEMYEGVIKTPAADPVNGRTPMDAMAMVVHMYDGRMCDRWYSAYRLSPVRAGAMVIPLRPGPKRAKNPRKRR